MAADGPAQSLRERVAGQMHAAARHVFAHRNQATFGVDGVPLSQFRSEWSKRRKHIRASILDGSYKFSGIRGVAIRKDKSKPRSLDNSRPISILTISDRIVQRAMLEVVWTSIRDRVYTPTSFGGIREYYVRGNARLRESHRSKSVREAIKRITDLQDEGNRFIFETDIQSFYGNIDRERLLGDLFACLADDTINYLLEDAIATELENGAELGDFRDLWSEGQGVPQGAVLSPVLANFYLYDFDRTIAEAGYHLVRYVDDLVVLCPDLANAEEAHRLVAAQVNALGLRIHPLDKADPKGRVKTRIVGPDGTFDFLGVEIGRFTIRPAASKWAAVRANIEEATSLQLLDKEPLIKVVHRTNQIVRGWVSAFDFSNIAPGDLTDRIDVLVRARITGWMRRAQFLRGHQSLCAKSAKRLGLISAHEIPMDPIRKSRSSARV